LEEKKALEITIKALKTTSKTSLLNSQLAEANKLKASPSFSNQLLATSRSVSTSDLSEVDAQSNADSTTDLDSSNNKFLANLNELNQEEKLNALTSNIQLLIENKSKLEQAFQAEKKKLRVF
jgi:hypothetical protein